MTRRAISGLLLAAFPLAPALADRGMIFLGKPSVSIYEPGQKAIVAWNRGREVMILATDAKASEEGKALGVIPLPSVPKVEKGSLDSFVAVQKLIWRHAPRLPAMTRAKGPLGPAASSGVRVVFHKKIGAHDITAVEARNLSAFVKWADEFVRRHGRAGLESLPPQWGEVVGDYIERGLRFFVFDLIEVGRETRTVEPLVYTFKSRRPFYPLKISRPMGGPTSVQVFLLTPRMPDIFSLRCPLSVATYWAGFLGWRPIMFPVSRPEILRVDKRLASLFGGRGAYFCALQYRGPASGLFADLEIGGFLRAAALSLKIRGRG